MTWKIQSKKDLGLWNSFYSESGEYGADWFWKNFGIKSSPLYKDECWSHIPKVWAEDVSKLLHTLQSSFDINFIQIKEKFCELVIYYSAPEYQREKINNLIKETKEKMCEKAIHP